LVKVTLLTAIQQWRLTRYNKFRLTWQPRGCQRSCAQTMHHEDYAWSSHDSLLADTWTCLPSR